MIRRVLRLRATRVAIVISGLLGLALSLSRLLGVHGPESALALGLVLPPFAAVAGASLVLDARREQSGESAVQLLRAGWIAALLAWLPAVVVLGLNQLRVRQCSPGEGLAFEVVGPGLGLWLSVWVGMLVAATVPRLPRTLAALVPLLWLGLGVYEFWSTPAIFVFGQFGGWFPGTLYDEDVALGATVLLFRLGTLLWLAAIGLLWAAAWRRDGAILGAPRLKPLLAAVVIASVAGWLHLNRAELGLGSRHDAIAEALGATDVGERCIVIAPRELDPESRRRLVNDCDYRVARAERALGVTQREKVRAYFYRSPEEKRYWMGAGRTYIAKPWRAEVHLQLGAWPHPVLAHEVVHVVAANASQGPFRVAGSAGGWLPNPGWIEGIAVAIEWPTRDALSPHQYVKALRDLERLPPLETVMSLRFLTLSPRIAYTVAGSFVRYLLDDRGADAVRAMHKAASADDAGGLAELEQGWLEFIDQRELYDGALELAELRFHYGSIFQRTCPHRVAALRADLAQDIAAGDRRRTLQTCDEILAIEPGELSALITRVAALARSGDFDGARQALSDLNDAPPPIRDRASEELADALWLRGHRDEALSIYSELLTHPQTEGEARQREVKQLAIREGGPGAALIRTLLIGQRGSPSSAPVAVHLASELDELRADGLGSYLEARQLLAQSQFEMALPKIHVARSRGLPSERLAREATRMEGRAAYAVGDMERAHSAWTSLVTDPFAEHEARDWLERLAYTEQSDR